MGFGLYTLERCTVVDHAGTLLDETLFTTSRSLLETKLIETIDRRAGFAEDALPIAWEQTLAGVDNALASYLPPWLEVRDEQRLRRALFADTRVTRAGQTLAVVVEQDALVHPPSGKRRKRQPAFRVGEESFATLEALGESAWVAALRELAGDPLVQFDFSTLLAAIPTLLWPPLDGPLAFTPFFESATFRERLQDEPSSVDLGFVVVGTWDGYLPQGHWLCLEPLRTLCDEAGVAFRFDAGGGR